MIADTLEHWRRYPLGAAWEKAFAFLEGVSPDIPAGRYAIAGDDIFAEVAEYVPVPGGTKPYEAHRVYMDLQYLLAGREWLLNAPLDTLRLRQPYNAERDFALYEVPAQESARVPLGGGMFAALYPHDGHCPGIARHGGLVGEPADELADESADEPDAGVATDVAGAAAVRAGQPVKKVVVKIRVALLAGMGNG
ncbi:YhcH/YjgK/YiaL family protein [Desulfovibrio psychrotolerans]|uniref:YhcH/YjgK/YiaL family protein n=1 Tax=Desulfovibrio psychrotolerans TaxID=415242 RepID=A0A7J0BS36_9BACT|nr:YhcH/YjgK/YiaL family protein [Desulfovibrio psychrotolerans]GFM35834.1 hypothetical protein DSM19430T_05180 [Desulfovibrio psychrotolerans]